MEEEDATISRIITDLEETLNQNPTTPISHSTLQDLQSLLNTNDPDLIFRFFDQLPSKGLSVSSLIHPISSAMDGGPTNLSLLASKVYLSLLLSPNSPVFTLFTPMAFLSLLRSIRRALKRPQHGANGGTRLTVTRKRKRGEKARGSKDITRSLNEFNEEESEYDGRTLLIVLEKLESVMGLIYLNRFPDSLKSLIQMVAEIPVLSLEMGASFGGYSGLTDLCSRILSRLLRSEHGDMASTAAEVLKSLTPLILMGKSQARTFALGFLRGKMMGLAKESDGVKKAVMNLPKYLANKAQEKAEPRGLAVEAIMEIVKAMEFKDQVGFAEYTVKMCQGKPNLRLIAVDLILMLMMSLRDRLCVDSDGKVEDSWGLSCLEALIQRCSDSSAAIRARALSNLAQLVGEFMSNEKNREVLKKVMGFREGEMNTLLRIRCMDEKAAVRKAALMLVTKFTGLFGGSVDGVVLKTLGISCSDPLVSIRKAAISAISEAFRTFSDESVTAEWLHSVPCLITDNETSIQEECEKLFLELVLDRVSRAGSSGSTLHDSNVKEKSIEKEIKLLFPEGVLGLLKEICNGEVTPWVKKICTSLGKKKRLKPKIAIALQNVIRSSESIWLKHSMAIEKWTAPAGAWFLLSEVSAYLPKAVDWEFLHHHWQLLDKYEAGGDFKSPLASRDEQEDEEGIVSSSVSWAGDRVCLLQTISNVSVELPPEAAADLAHNLLKRIEGFNMHTTEVNAHVKALRTLCRQKALNATEADMLVLKWVHQLLSKASQILEKFISEISEANKDSSFFTPPRSGREGKKAMAVSRSLSEVVTAVYTIGSVVIVCPTADMSSIVPLLYTIITSGNSGPNLNKLPGPSVSIKQIAPSLYIQAWLTLGKLCLADGKLAKSYIPLFVQNFEGVPILESLVRSLRHPSIALSIVLQKELEKSDCVALRNNIVVMMADFCVRYTALVDCYIAKITMCLRDSCELVRRQTFILLSRLLQRDYVKWRGVLFLRFLLSLVDESEKIRQLADYLFGNILKAKAPLLAYNSFVEAIFVLNDCHVHNGLNDSRGLQTEHRLFSIRGNDEKSRSKRMHIYVSLLKQMAPEHLLATFAKLCAEILAAASDGMLNIEDATGQSVLQDAFQILACKEIRITATRGSASDAGEIEEEAGDAGASSAAAKGRAITQAVRKGLIQNTIPIFIELKRLLESKNSPLSGSLMECLRILLKDYKNEIDDILVADRQLQKELTYDMQKYESAKAAAAVATSPALSKGHSSLAKNLQTDSRMASAMANAAAAATARSVLKEVNTQTPPLSAMSVPKLKTAQRGTAARNDRPLHVLESLRSRKSFDSDEEN